MINWNKPIETMDGRRAKVLTCVAAGEKNARAVYVTPKENFCFGDVFIVNDDGCRRDDRASDRDWQEPFIRNVRIKREGWVLVEPKKNWTSYGSIVAIFGTRYVYPTEQEALRAKEYHNMDLETKAVPFEWEE